MTEKYESLKIPEIIPREYVNVFDSFNVFGYGPLVAVSPRNFAIANVIRTPESELNRKLQHYQEDLREKYDKGEIELDEKQKYIITYSPHELKDYLIEAIKKEKGTKKLWTSAGPTAISEGHLERDVLTARVVSRRRGGRGKVLRDWAVTVKSPLYKEGPAVAYSSISCQCDDYRWIKSKSTDTLCVHMALAILQSDHDHIQPENKRLINIESLGVPYIPFSLSPNTEMDVVLRHYLMGEGYYEINKRLLNDPENFDPLYLKAIEDGFLVFGVVPQKRTRKRPIEKGYLKAIEYTKGEMEKRFRRAGFRKSGLPVVEFKDTSWETICENYEKGDEMIRLLFNENFPPVFVHRRKLDDVEVFYKPQDIHPFSLLEEEVESVDDKTRRKTKTRVMIPGPRMLPELGRMPIVGNFKREYKELIRYYPGDKQKLIQQLGLGLF